MHDVHHIENAQKIITPMQWPAWPQASTRSSTAVSEVLTSGRWAISGMKTEAKCWEQRFCEAFSNYLKVPYGVATSNGTAALTIALEALGVGVGDEVIVPGLTWVACASAVLTVGAIPVLVDVDHTFCLSLEETERAITEKTRAVILVHAYCNLADAEAFARLCKDRGLFLIEDCSQAHGGEWNGRKVGSFSSIACFSLQQVKLLTCGEGGIAVTADQDLYNRMQELRADGRLYKQDAKVGKMELEESGSVQGRNYCLSELQSALAFGQLSELDEQNARRHSNALRLDSLLSKIPGVSTPKAAISVTSRVYYQYLVRFDPIILRYNTQELVSTMCQQLNLHCEMIDSPLNRNKLYVPHSTRRIGESHPGWNRIRPDQYNLPVSLELQQTHIALSHWMLLGEPAMVDLAAQKIREIALDLMNSP